MRKTAVTLFWYALAIYGPCLLIFAILEEQTVWTFLTLPVIFAEQFLPFGRVASQTIAVAIFWIGLTAIAYKTSTDDAYVRVRFMCFFFWLSFMAMLMTLFTLHSSK